MRTFVYQINGVTVELRHPPLSLGLSQRALVPTAEAWRNLARSRYGNNVVAVVVCWDDNGRVRYEVEYREDRPWQHQG